jgi:hypothetical protein
VDRIRAAVEAKQSVHLNLVNYKKNGSKFDNSFFLCPLFDDDHKVVYYVGIQAVAGRKEEEAFYAGLLTDNFKS